RRETSSLAMLGMTEARELQVAQQLVDTLTAIDRVVVMEMQFGHVPHLHRARQAEADLVRDRAQALDRLERTLRFKRGHEYLGMRHVARDLDVGHAERRQPVLGHRFAHQRAQLPAELRGDAVGTVEGLGHRDWATGLGMETRTGERRNGVEAGMEERWLATTVPCSRLPFRLDAYSVRWTSMRSKHSIWSPGLTSL